MIDDEERVEGIERPTGLGYQPQLDGLRALAVFAVVAAHTGAPAFRGGVIGVDVFFVLSGFLITTLLVSEFDREGGIALRRFYVRRSLRLFPALVVVLLFVTITFAAFQPYLARETLAGVPASLFYVSAWLRAFDVSQLGWLGHTWSLSVEEHFYLFWPLLLLIICRRARRRLTLWVCALFVGAVVYRSIAQAAGASVARLYNSPDMRAEQLLGGCLLAVVLGYIRADTIRPSLRRAHTIVFFASVLIVTALMAIPNDYIGARVSDGSATTYFRHGVSTLITAASAVIIGHLFIWRATWVAKFLSTRPLVWLGRRSYGIYLWHVPLFGLFFLKGEPNSLRFSVRIALIFVTVAVAGLSYRLIEAPLLARRPTGGHNGDADPATVRAGSRSGCRANMHSPQTFPAGEHSSGGSSWRRHRSSRDRNISSQ